MWELLRFIPFLHIRRNLALGEIAHARPNLLLLFCKLELRHTRSLINRVLKSVALPHAEVHATYCMLFLPFEEFGYALTAVVGHPRDGVDIDAAAHSLLERHAVRLVEKLLGKPESRRALTRELLEPFMRA